MKLTCANCNLRLAPFHFIKGRRIYSICDLCQIQSLSFSDYYNYSNQIYAQIADFQYQGALKPTKTVSFNLTLDQRQTLKSLINNYDQASVVLKQHLPRRQLNERLVAYENHQIQIQDDGSFFDNLSQLGFDVTHLHNLQRVDYSTRMWLYHHYHQTCQYCGRIGYSIDHLTPVSRGGSNELSNLILACKECNKLKGDMPYEWFQDFNLKTKLLNHKLVIGERQINQLKEKQETLARQLAAYSHRTQILQDAQTTLYRQQIKMQQVLLDGLTADYQKLSNLRKDYIKTRYQMAQLEKREE